MANYCYGMNYECTVYVVMMIDYRIHINFIFSFSYLLLRLNIMNFIYGIGVIN